MIGWVIMGMCKLHVLWAYQLSTHQISSIFHIGRKPCKEEGEYVGTNLWKYVSSGIRLYEPVQGHGGVGQGGQNILPLLTCSPTSHSCFFRLPPFLTLHIGCTIQHHLTLNPASCPLHFCLFRLSSPLFSRVPILPRRGNLLKTLGGYVWLITSSSFKRCSCNKIL